MVTKFQGKHAVPVICKRCGKETFEYKSAIIDNLPYWVHKRDCPK